MRRLTPWPLTRALIASGFVLGSAVTWPQLARAQSAPARPLITAPIEDTRLTRLAGNTRPEANVANDRGVEPDSFPMQHMQLLLKRPAEREAALQAYLAQLHDRSSANFHRWLSAVEFGRRFGPSQQDITSITGWLRQHGLVVNGVSAAATVIDFSGSAGQLHTAFHTEIHALSVRGATHIANMSDPQIPAALAPAVAGIVSLNDFRPHTFRRARANYTISSGIRALAPADLATIYNLNPLFNKGLAGQGQTIAVIEDSDVYSTADWSTFRSTFGLSSYTTGSFTQIHPAPLSGQNNCSDPGVASNGADGEAILDAEWASAAAPGAAIELVSCADTATTFGGLIALQNLLNQSSTPPAIVSISYGECEAANGASANSAYISTYQQAVAEGVSVFVSAGDQGAAGCDPDQTAASHGIGVNAFASTPYNVAVGGTDFGDAYAGTTSTYWSTTNTTTYGSALSYIPEIPWNDSCASRLITLFEGYSASYGSSGFCNSTTGAGLQTTVAGSGGPSACASGTPSTASVVGGSCAGTAKPSWQSGVTGIPGDGVRDLPDVSLFAGNGIWGHYYVYCWSDTAAGGAACAAAPSTWSGAGGTSFSSPILAGIQALVNQNAGARQGNPNYVYYILAASQGASGASCNSSSGNATAAGCVFYDVTLGDIDVDCTGPYNCYQPSGTYGALSTGDTTYAMAYNTGTGWDFATGLGSINASNLVTYWSSSDLSLSVSGSALAAAQLSYTLTVTDSGPQSATGVVVTTLLPSGVSLLTSASSSNCVQSGQTVTCTVGTLAVGGTTALTIVAQSNTSQTVSLTFKATSNNTDLNPADGSKTVSLAATGTTNGNSTDGPMPPWAYVALGLLFIGIASRRRPAGA